MTKTERITRKHLSVGNTVQHLSVWKVIIAITGAGVHISGTRVFFDDGSEWVIASPNTKITRQVKEN